MFKNLAFKHRHLLWLVILGTIIRAFYGVYAKAWLRAPDQLAWELGLREMLNSGEWSYKQIAHYPHEGGSFVIGLVALLFIVLPSSLPALSITALLFDTASRIIQVFIAKKLFGPKTALFFSLWLCIPVPLLLSWSSVNLGLHHLSSFWPFVFLFALSRYQNHRRIALAIGLICGLALSFAYNNVILLPAYAIFLFLHSSTFRDKIFSFLFYIVGFLVAFSPHILLRNYMDAGFHLEHLSATEIREFGIEELFSWQSFKNVFLVGLSPLPASFFLSAGGMVPGMIQHLFVLLLLVLTAFVSFQRHSSFSSPEKMSLVLILLYLMMYAISPFYSGSPRSDSYYYYRHLAYLLPLLMLFITYELSFLRKIGERFLVLSLLVSFTFTGLYCYSTQAPTQAFIREEGWILGRKYGEDPAKMMALLKMSPEEQRKELTIGFGWGTSAALFSNKTLKDSTELNEFIRIFQNYPESQRADFYRGFRIAFQSGITPVLDSTLLPFLDKKLAP